jgi:aminocarboxymuconate-semialdehyde decarboxylase
MIFGGVFERFKNLKVAFAHGGGSFPSTIGRIAHGFDVRPDLTAIDNQINPKNYLGKFFVDSLTHDPRALQYIIDLVGEDKVMLGTDYPFPLGELSPGETIKALEVSDIVKQKLYFENALQWLGIEKSRLIK